MLTRYLDKSKGLEVSMKKYKVIFHVDEISKWKLTLANVDNLINAIDDKSYEVVILANSEAVKYYDTSQKLDADIKGIAGLQARGVQFVACNNALNANKIDRKNIIDGVSIVPAGVLELVEKQGEGYAYIRP